MTKLVRYDAMCAAIEAAYKVDEVKDIRDKARAFEVYARQAKNVEAEQQACRIRLRAERKAGQLLASMEKAKPPAGPGRGKVGNKREPTFRETTTLDDLGVSKKQSSDWQKLAAIPQKTFDQSLAQTERPTTSGILRATETVIHHGIIRADGERRTLLVAKNALWLWGRLQDFDRRGLLSMSPAKVMETATDEMLDDIHTLAPKVSAWLRRIGAINDR